MSNVVQIPECDLELQGHWLYVRQCLKPDTYAGTEIIRCEKDKKRSHVCEVLAVGPRVGGKRDKPRRWRMQRGIPMHQCSPFEPGDFVLVPENSPHNLLKNSPYDKYEFFVDESVILGVFKDD